MSARQLPKANNNQRGAVLDPHVVVALHGVTADTREFKTRACRGNGFCPSWYFFKQCQISCLCGYS